MCITKYHVTYDLSYRIELPYDVTKLYATKLNLQSTYEYLISTRQVNYCSVTRCLIVG